MKRNINFLLSLCLIVALFFGNSSFSTISSAATNNEEYVLAYYNIATDTETLLTASEAESKFGICIDPSTKNIVAKPHDPTVEIKEKKLTEQEKEEIKQKDKNALFDSVLPEELKSVDDSQLSTYSTESTTSDPRTKVTNTNIHPYCSTAKIYSSDQWIGTGFAVGYNLLATARHCVQSDTGWKSSVTAYFGYNGNSSTYFYKADNCIGYIYYPTETIESSLQDWAFVVWGSNTVYSTGCFGMSGTAYTGMEVKTVGYPQDLDSGNYMYQCSGTILSCEDYELCTDLRTYNGQSGSPIYQETSDGAYAIAIHRAAYHSDDGTVHREYSRRIDSGLIEWLRSNGYV